MKFAKDYMCWYTCVEYTVSWFIEPYEGGGGDNRRYRRSKKKRSPKRAEGGAEAKVDRAVLHILTVLRVPPALVKFVRLSSF